MAKKFHLAGIVPVAGQDLGFGFQWHDALMPIAQNWTAVEQAVWECAWAGCETIWIVCHNDMKPLIRHRIGEMVQDPVVGNNNYMKQSKKWIPIYYVPVHPNDRKKRDCLTWSVIYGAKVATRIGNSLSKWVTPERFYASFPYGVYDPSILHQHRAEISSTNRFFLESNGRSAAEGEYLGFTYNLEDCRDIKVALYQRATQEMAPIKGPEDLKRGKFPFKKLPIAERYSGRFLTLDKLLDVLNFRVDTTAVSVAVPAYASIDSWENYTRYFKTNLINVIKRPPKKVIGYREWNPFQTEEEDAEESPDN